MAWNEPGGNGNNNHDPWSNGGNKDRGGNRGGPDQGPPDLDEALRKLQDRLNSLFGGKKGGGRSGRNGGSHGGYGLVIILLVVIALFWAGSGVYTIDQPERGVVLRFGEFHDVVNPGLHWNPPLIDTITRVNVDEVRTDDHRSLMLTEDENIVDINMTVQYVAADPKAFVLNVRDPESSLRQGAESALRHVVGTTQMHLILTEGRDALATDVQTFLQKYMDQYGTGIRISRVNIKNAQAPSQVQAAFDDVIKAREDEQRLKNEAQAYANGVVPEARGNAQRIIEEANAYHDEVISKAEGDAARFTALMTEYHRAPNVTRERLYLETMEQILAQSPKVMVDVDGGNNMMYLPLDKLTSGQSSIRRTSSGAVQLDDTQLQQLTNQVLQRVRQQSSSSRGVR